MLRVHARAQLAAPASPQACCCCCCWHVPPADTLRHHKLGVAEEEEMPHTLLTVPAALALLWVVLALPQVRRPVLGKAWAQTRARR